jgi:hypothetical protein
MYYSVRQWMTVPRRPAGPAQAGADLFRKLLRLHRARLGAGYRSDRDAPDVLLSQVPAGLGGPPAPSLCPL